MVDRLRYSHVQLEQYFDRIALPKQKRLFSVATISDDEKLSYLALLHKHHLVRIPFENLTQHYSWHRTVNVRPQHLFNKIVPPPSRRGGYCMEVNSLLHTVLLSLGFQVYMAGARIYKKDIDKYGGFSHCVNIIIIGNDRYMVDVGFGANGPTAPAPLHHDEPRVHIEGTGALMRFVHEPIPQQVDQGQKVWIYQNQINSDAEWVPMYCFVDIEFLLEDIRGLNLIPWKSPSSWFTQKVVLLRFTTDAEGDAEAPAFMSDKAVAEGKIDGALILFQDTLKWRREGQTVQIAKFETEEQRLDAIKKYFGIEFDEEDREAIRGTTTELRETPFAI
ncbi:cysteine proteinase [Daldinia caldariorum]|uniref:cysteine proteinase n=1 Tax=Daldinia caldariorum TaxID=326644 RepID=UPI0020074CE2|nr:cysteine proteinase [Daldinia caldariorum]KAI1468177.1 cysteine proteinase [Daldinia caldariorum]